MHRCPFVRCEKYSIAIFADGLDGRRRLCLLGSWWPLYINQSEHFRPLSSADEGLSVRRTLRKGFSLRSNNSSGRPPCIVASRQHCTDSPLRRSRRCRCLHAQSSFFMIYKLWVVLSFSLFLLTQLHCSSNSRGHGGIITSGGRRTDAVVVALLKAAAKSVILQTHNLYFFLV
jgi:hypothetical protein